MNINDSNIIQTIKKLLEDGDINTIAGIMTDFNTKVSSEKHQEVIKLIDNSTYKEQIESLIRGMLGIYG